LHHEKNYSQFAGATFSLVKEGEIFFAKGYGYAEVENKRPVMAETTLFHPGSVSKLFTWTAVMQLFEQGKLDLNTDVNNYLKDFKIPDTYPEPVTLTNLLTHTPGFEDVWSGMAARSAEELVPLGEFLAQKMPPRFLAPSEFTAYSNYGTALAGYIVQTVSGIPFEDYVEENIFKPLDMQHCTFRQPLPSHLADDMSVGYSFKNGLFKAEDFELINGLAPAGSLSASATAMAKFMIAYLQNGKYGEDRILKAETVELMRTQLFTHDSRLDGNAYGFWERTLNNKRTIGHGGDTVWFHSLLILLPEHSIGFFISYNSAGAGVLLQDKFLQAFMDHYYPVPEAPEPKPSPDFKTRADRFRGYYGMTRSVFSTYERLANLMMTVQVKATDQGTLLTPYPAGLGAKQWVEVEPLVFQELGGQETLIFQEDSQGRITHAFISEFPIFALVKLSWHQAPPFHYSLLAVSIILFLSTLAWPISAFFRVLCRRKKEETHAPRSARWIAGVMSMLLVIFVLCMATVLSDQMNIMFGVPPLVKILLVLPLISVVIAIAALIVTFFAWKNKYWSWCSRLHYTLVVLAALAFIWFLNYWNLLGYHF
jgi:CubicO group peptidase (beta-lactamase class C family)